MFSGLDLYRIDADPTDPAYHLITADTGWTVDNLYHLYDLHDLLIDRHLCELCNG